MTNLIPLLVAIPLGVGFLTPLAARVHARLPEWMAVAACVALLVLSGTLLGKETIYNMGGWSTPLGIDLRVDDLTTLMLVTINFVAVVVATYSIHATQDRSSRHRFYSLFLFVVAGTNGVALTGDLFNLYVFMEITAIASYALVAYEGEAEDLEASFKYAVLGGLSSSVILIGITLLYGMTGTLNMTHLASRLSESSATAPIQFALGLFFCGFGLKAALVPFHTWLPDAYPSAPAPISAILAGVVSKVTGVYVLARLLFNVFGINDDLLLLMRWMGGVTMVVGGLMALGQWDIKRLLAYSSVSQAGLIVLALGFGSTLGVVGAVFQLVNHAVFKPLLFLSGDQVAAAAGTRDLRQMHRSASRFTRASCLVGSLSLAGIPPLNGFWSKLIIVFAGVQIGHAGWAAAVVVMSMVTLAYQMKVQKAITPKSNAASSDPENRAPRSRQSWLTAIPIVVLVIGCVGLSLLVVTGLEDPIMIGPAADALLEGPWSE